jgi:hypothetical protein
LYPIGGFTAFDLPIGKAIFDKGQRIEFVKNFELPHMGELFIHVVNPDSTRAS